MPRILVVDDDPGVRDLLEVVLGSAGHQIFMASDGRQALHVIRHATPDLMVLDMLMPEMDGIELLRRLQGPSVPKVIAISGAPDEWKLLHVAQHLGARHTLKKPFFPTEALRAIASVLETS
jgi:two-component system response regulator AdeR